MFSRRVINVGRRGWTFSNPISSHRFGILSFLSRKTVKTIQDVPKPQNWREDCIVDMAKVLDDGDKEKLNKFAKQLFSKHEIESAIVTIGNVCSYSTKDAANGKVKEFGIHLANTWGVGKPGKNNGFVLLFAQDQRRIEMITHLLEHDVLIQIQQEKMIPRFKKEEYGRGIVEGMEDVVRKIVHKRSTNDNDQERLTKNGLELYFVVALYVYFGIIAWEQMKGKESEHEVEVPKDEEKSNTRKKQTSVAKDNHDHTHFPWHYLYFWMWMSSTSDAQNSSTSAHTQITSPALPLSSSASASSGDYSGGLLAESSGSSWNSDSTRNKEIATKTHTKATSSARTSTSYDYDDSSSSGSSWGSSSKDNSGDSFGDSFGWSSGSSWDSGSSGSGSYSGGSSSSGSGSSW